MKKILLFIFILALYVLPAYFAPFDAVWYKSLVKPNITPPDFVFQIVWFCLFILLSISATVNLTTKTIDNKRFYIVVLFLNYAFIQLYSYIQFANKDLLLALVDIIFVLLTSLILYYAGKSFNKKAAYLIIPLIVWSAYAAFIQAGLIQLNASALIQSILRLN